MQKSLSIRVEKKLRRQPVTPNNSVYYQPNSSQHCTLNSLQQYGSPFIQLGLVMTSYD